MTFTLRTLITLVTILIAAPAFVYAQTAGTPTTSSLLTTQTSTTAPSSSSGFLQDGTFGCGGASYGSVGLQGPKGSFVPTFDMASFDQQRILTYKVCVLDKIASSVKEAVTSQIAQTGIDWANKANNGQGVFPKDISSRQLSISDKVFNNFINGPALDELSPLDKQDIKASLTRNYARATRKQASELSCPEFTPEQLKNVRNGHASFQDNLKYIYNPACSRNGAYLIAKQQLADRIAQAQRNDEIKLNRSNGILDVTRDVTIDLGNGKTVTRKQVVTPGYLIAQQLSQILGTGLRQAENATEINSLISSALANLGTRMLTDVNGFSGLSTALGSQPSYVSRLATDAVNRTRNSMVGAASAILANAMRTETEFSRARFAGVSILNDTATQLRDWERTCYSDMSAQAEKSVVDSVKSNICPQSVGTTTISCGIPIRVTKTYASNILEVSAPTPTKLIVNGFTTRDRSRIELTLQGTETSTAPITIQPDTTNAWRSGPLDISAMSDGTITVQAIEYFADGSGTHGPATATVTKATTDGVITLTLPTTLPALTITASANGTSKSVTLQRDTTHSQSVIDANITQNRTLLQKDVANSQKAITVLSQMRSALTNATTAQGQRQVLAILDQLVARHLIHSASAVRDAESQNNSIAATVVTIKSRTKQSWEGGWCQPVNWKDHIVN